MTKVDAQLIFNKVQDQIDTLNHVEAEPESELYVMFTLAEARYLTELLGRYEIPEMLK